MITSTFLTSLHADFGRKVRIVWKFVEIESEYIADKKTPYTRITTCSVDFVISDLQSLGFEVSEIKKNDF